MRRLPSREELVDFIREHSGKVGVREIARRRGVSHVTISKQRNKITGLACRLLQERTPLGTR